MLRRSVWRLGAVAAVCLPAVPAHAGYADHMSLSCRVDVAGPVRPGDPPWFNAVSLHYRINLKASAVNGETVQLEQRDVGGPKLLWDRPAGTAAPTSHYILDLQTGRLFVSFDKFELDGRKFSLTTRQLRCTDRLRKIAV